MNGKKRWKNLTDIQKVATVLLTFLQFILLIAALRDIHRRSVDQINGSRLLWTVAVFINFIGPLAYFTLGRKR